VQVSGGDKKGSLLLRIKDAIEFLKTAGFGQSDPGSTNVWDHDHRDSVKFLIETTTGDVPLYIGGAGFYLYSLAVPKTALTTDYQADITPWSLPPCRGYGWSVCWQGGRPVFQLESPVGGTGSEILDQGSPFFFVREPMAGAVGPEIEINQQVCHLMDLRWRKDKHAWCKIDPRGDLAAIARWEHQDGFDYLTVAREELDDYLVISGSCVVRVFEVARAENWGAVPREQRGVKSIGDPGREVYAELSIFGDAAHPAASILRGFQAIRPDERSSEGRLLHGRPREYQKFIIQDWKHGETKEWPCNPEMLGNYFVPSDLPYETSPAFFRPEVLAQYQQNPEKFTIGDRRIQCRDTWSLRYDTNEEGQVHAYIIDLAALPGEEQLHWKAFNEQPKGSISKRSYETDFGGSFGLPDDPLASLKRTIHSFPTKDATGRDCPLWRLPTLPSTRDVDSLNYIVTDSPLEWEQQVFRLAQIMVEGLNESYINQLAEVHKVRDKRLKSGKQLARVIAKSGLAQDEVNRTMQPFAEVWELRSRIAHAGSGKAHVGSKEHFRGLLERFDSALRSLADIVRSGRLSVSA